MVNNNVKRKDSRAGKSLSPARRTELKAQRKVKLGGLSPTAFGLKRDLKLLEWIRNWGYTSKAILQKLAETTRHGTSARLVKRGWIEETPTPTGLPIQSYLTLTALGLHESEQRAEKLHHYPFLQSQKVRHNKIRHDLVAQKFTLDALLKGVIIRYETELMTQEKSLPGTKQPDCTFIIQNPSAGLDGAPSTITYAVEVELSRKWDRDFDDFRIKIIRAIQAGKYSSFHLVTDIKAIKKAYEEGMLAGTKIPLWEISSKVNKWVQTGKYATVPDWIGKGPDDPLTRFRCYLIESK
ncbi:hypothetical protein M2128_002251 [Polynucleobacter sphagniphilus]|uniref:hypothetical protein n=1 Tax=Polynucleobacter sphagniphilus TaxID=1743169 RepID=UPI0024759EF3|nr:hypothetical protein [Polynucleobacter sphagniphilus]MDH6303304.1 hypothetical protein [Polynucleobacter sphagniphilus]